ncbi:TPA: hypothetical protein DEP30_02165 [Candidatus Nomurabacteria bacterium]|uniref:Uncharacterized protein n=1 Tax=Candidatus Nomurabacteria bacterium GW2011_GWE1_35_16 TaxID=1618761 RepID=A0A0G0BC08_9BACT|nr:MAG: hypothetical protein UR55_C0002G0108 [Candidatus Nomurabacteria bacterium GW2011_GWF1_34_20]KKP63687.1 MAG: hypothetical protein UR57_C0002G0108 [Candidatus Nomurabacteria bacterium GW2011_GWE2_34_25]KKP66889.1 MAG: hypothetical protein UR64_C0002G0105 [Candidatus Nomurabacteria bacterium GW2011_GWE1_35_16]KKP83515.1 MAG: hypothetical protein UR85_C0004G0109 [Candidatus Nomurabacteria bacterium GW2011_GWF2_35_66]HAE36553.1 hypothetical protein [Candidatus Nomurabacteria bacterium]
MESQTKTCQNCKEDFIIEPDDFNFYEKIKVPAPTFCPECRAQRRFSWRNDSSLYSRVCGLCDKKLITIYSIESEINAFCNKCWWSDKWDPTDYSVDYNFSKSFFEQFDTLVKKVPHMAMVNDNGVGSVNSEYTHDFSFSKNCYMVFCAWNIENAMYSYYLIAGKNISDSLNVMVNNEWIYESIQPENCYQIKYSHFAVNCIDSSFIFDCRNCSDCFMCSGVRNKKYCFKNEQYTKDEYEKILKEYRLDTFSGVEKAKKEYDQFILKTPRRFAHIIHSNNCTGDLIINGKNSLDCFNVQAPENCRFVVNSDTSSESYDLLASGKNSECYEGVTSDHSNRNLFGVFSWKSQNIEYTQHCHSSKNLFGCVGLRNKQYCIFNKQYTKEEYEELVPKIKKQMNDIPYITKKGIIYKYGEFYPSELSPFGYNETLAQERFPLSKDEILDKGYVFQDNVQKTINKETIIPKDLPESIFDIDNSITNEVLKCIDCGRNYKITEDELTFYKKMQIPIPRRCFYCRHANRIKRRNPYKLWHRKCMKPDCTNEFETSYSPERPEIVYCEKCYQNEVI